MRLPAVLVAFLALAWVAPVPAFELLRVDNNPCSSSQNLFFKAHSVLVDTSPLAAAGFQALGDDARSRWNLSIGSFQFGTGSGSPCNLTDGVATLAFGDADCNGAAFAGQLVAATTSRFNLRTGELADADVVFDTNQPVFDDADLFREVAMHELGHVLGLAHSDACGASGDGTLMKTTINRSAPRLFFPSADDKAGANAIYAAATGGSVSSGKSGCAVAPRASGAPCVVLLVLAVIAARRRCAWSAPTRSARWSPVCDRPCT